MSGSLFKRYFLALFAAVVIPLLLNGSSDAVFSYRDQRRMLDALLQAEAEAAAGRIASFLESIRTQLSWTVRHGWSGGTAEQHRLDALGLLRQVPAVVSVTLVDGEGRERLYLSRVELNRAGSDRDLSQAAPIAGARAAGLWHGPVVFFQGSEPFMTIALAGNRKAAGIVVAEINLKLIQEVVAAIRIGRTGHAFVLDHLGRLIAHPEISRVLRGSSTESEAAGQRLRRAVELAGGRAIRTEDAEGKVVVAAMAPVAGVAWSVFVEQPLAEAFEPIYGAFWRTGGLLLAGTGLAAGLAFGLARRMTGPIRLLEEGAEKIGAGNFQHRIEISTGDELERLAGRFNRMAQELMVSQERKDRIDRLKRFLAPQVAELVEQAGDDSLLAGQRLEVVAIFCDLRGFTAFSARAEPQEIMAVLGEYHGALGPVVARYGATLTSFSGDGVMLLMNAPVPCPDPAQAAVEMGIELQRSVQKQAQKWRSRGHAIGFGVGLAMGPATVGRIGTDSRSDYTAIGSVVNLAARLCAMAANEQVLAEAKVADAVRGRIEPLPLGERRIKGFEQPLMVYDVGRQWRGPGAAKGGGNARPS